MTLWHLLNAISFTAPLSCALVEGKRTGGLGIFIGLIVGLIIGLGSAWGSNWIGYHNYQRIVKVESEIKQEFFSCLSYIGMVFWIFAASGIAFYTMKLILFHTI